MMKLTNFKALIICSSLIPLLINAADSGKLIIGYGVHDAAPYAIEKSEKLHNGIIKDIITEISDELDISVTYINTPRKRIERYLENNTIHLVLFTNPAWLNNSDKLQWSNTIFIERNVMVMKAENSNKYQELLDFKGMIIGTIRGYKYPELQPFFDKEYFVRYDVSNLHVNFIRLMLGRIDVLVDADVLINYQLKQNENADNLKVLPFTVSQHNIRAALSPDAPVTLGQFNKALKKLKDQGVIAAIFKKYQIDK